MKRMEKYIPNLLLTMILVFALIGLEGIMFAKNQLMRSEPVSYTHLRAHET